MRRLIVLDTNCLVQILSQHSPYRPAWDAFRKGEYELCVSNEILNEYEEILERVANALSLTSFPPCLPFPNRVCASRCERYLLFLPTSTAFRSQLQRFDSEPALVSRSASPSPPSNHSPHRFLRATKASEPGIGDFQWKRCKLEACSPEWSCSR